MWQIGQFLKKIPLPKLLTYLSLILGHLDGRKSWKIQPDIFFCLEYQMEKRDIHELGKDSNEHKRSLFCIKLAAKNVKDANPV